MGYQNKVIGITSDEERAFYASQETEFINIEICGEADGESAFKESRDIEVANSNFYLRYPFWHNTNLKVNNSNFYDKARAAFWYDENVEVNCCNGYGVKYFRECTNLKISSSTFESEEIGWRCNNVEVVSSNITGFYAFFQSSDIVIHGIEFKGKYSFQYAKNLTIENSNLDTKDAFWHAENVVVRNSTIKSEYLAWYANGITFINCKIIGTQPICYAKNVRFVNCEFEKADLSFEYSEVNGDIYGDIISIKNPLSGSILIDKIPEMIIDKNDRSHGAFSIKEKYKN